MRGFLKSPWAGPLIIVAVVMLANLVFLSGLTDGNPLYSRSQLFTTSSKQILPGQSTLDPNDGTITHALGYTAAQQIFHGHLPWWNYNEQVGAPLAGDMQSAALFPPTLILGLNHGFLLFRITLEIIAGVITYYLILRLGMRRLTGVVFGVAFALNGTLAWFGSPNFNTIAFLPMVLLGVEIAFDSTIKHKKRGWLVLALALALALTSGFPEEVYLGGLLIALWSIIRLYQLRHDAWKPFLLKLACGVTVGVLFAAPLLIAFFDYLQSAFLGHGSMIANGSINHAGLPMFFIPYIYGGLYQSTGFTPTGVLPSIWGNTGGYITIPLLFFAIFSLFQKNMRAFKILLAVTAGVLVARIYGFPYLTSLFHIIPAMSQVAVYRYVDPIVELAVILLAAFGFNSLTSSKKLHRKQVLISLAIVLGFCLILLAIVASHVHILPSMGQRAPLATYGTLVWSFGCLALVVLAALLAPPKYRKVICSVVVICDVLLMFIIPQLSAPRTTSMDTTPVTFLQSHIGNDRMFTLGPLQPNYNSYYGIASIDTDNLPLPKNWTDYISNSLDPNANVTSFAGVDPGVPGMLTPKGYFLTRLQAYENVGVKYVFASPAFFTPDEVQSAGLKLVFSSPSGEIYQLPNPKPYFETTNGSCTVTPASKSEVHVSCTKPGQLIRRELYMPGWTVKANGKSLPITQRGSLFQAVNLPAGNHDLEFNFLPPHMIIGYLLFAGAVLFTGIVYLKEPVEDLLAKKSKKT